MNSPIGEWLVGNIETTVFSYQEKKDLQEFKEKYKGKIHIDPEVLKMPKRYLYGDRTDLTNKIILVIIGYCKKIKPILDNTKKPCYALPRRRRPRTSQLALWILYNQYRWSSHESGQIRPGYGPVFYSRRIS